MATDFAASKRSAAHRGDPEGATALVVGTELMSDTTVVSVAGEIDLVTVDQFAGVLRMHLDDGEPTVVIDLSQVGYLSSSGIRVLLAALLHARWRGQTVRVVLSPAARRTAVVLDAIGELETGSAGSSAHGLSGDGRNPS